MASHMSAVKEVLGRPAPDVLLLEEHHKHFFHDQATSSAESSSDEDDPLESLLALPRLCRSTVAMRRTLTLSIQLTGALLHWLI